jgi:predicted thioesterase
VESRTHHTVGEEDTATALGSGDVAVLATPRLLAWMEAATVEAAAAVLRPGQTSVGVRVNLTHLRASPVGSTVEVVASRSEHADSADTGRLRFEVVATGEGGRILATGTVERAVVDRQRFLERAGSR